ncbi:MAG: hypothetical protein EON84_04040 [Bradyrhizobiaceae bacterium]|jgi:hypothetical protein|nr:MAG: hypothetical protein EON84_04040 [Bradyrhizobiaceae bacterium]
MTKKSTLLVAGLLIASSGAALAQAPPTPSTPPAQTAPPATDRADANCTPTRTDAQGTITPVPDSSAAKSSENLGDKLAKSDGVLCPPGNVDSTIRAPTPPSTGGTMPVIPPPGSPGGDPSVRPK